MSAAELLATAREAAARGAAIVREGARTRDFAVTLKARSDYVTEVDVASERAVRDAIRARHPDHAILGEEGGLAGGSAADAHAPEWCWVVDPLDGTTNFIRGLPFFAVSIGLERRGVPVVGVVVDPLHGSEWWAAEGQGAFKDGRPIRVSAEPDARQALTLTGIPFRNLDKLEEYLPGLRRVAHATAGVRRMGSAALDLASIADGRAEAFWEYGLGRWDLCAGTVLIREAGGTVTDLGGGGTFLESGDVLASNGRVHGALLRCVDPRLPPDAPAPGDNSIN